MRSAPVLAVLFITNLVGCSTSVLVVAVTMLCVVLPFSAAECAMVEPNGAEVIVPLSRFDNGAIW